MPRDVVTIDDLSEDEIQHIFSLADEILATQGTPGLPHRVRGRLALASEHVLATLFYEASTRTRLSFESAMLRLGGQYLSSADPKTTSTAKGETIADTVRVVENYADAIVMRHPCEGAVRVAAEYASIPVINAGDGGHEHPTQTLCDLYTLQREKGTLKDLNVMLWGDLKHGRTVHSLVYGLARFGARIIPVAGQGLGLPEHVVRRLHRDYDCTAVPPEEMGAVEQGEVPLDVVYLTPDKPHQRSLFTDLDGQTPTRLPANAFSSIDACYVTRLQRERIVGGGQPGDYTVIDKQFLEGKRYRDSKVLHPLPRVGELGYDMDNDERAVYFKQASYGVPVRMALIAALLELRPGLLSKSAPKRRHLEYHRQTLKCDNPLCVTMLETEQRYLKQKYLVINEEDHLLVRCVYCEHETAPACVGHESTRKYAPNDSPLDPHPDLVFFNSPAEAKAAGYSPSRE